MNGAAVTPRNTSPSPSEALHKVAQCLAIHAQQKSCNQDSLSNLCITLSRGLDYAIANKQVPAIVSELPAVFKLVCQRRNECSLQASIAVLMVTVKSACKAQWFSNQECQELLTLADEMVGLFCITEGFSCEQADIIPTASKIIPRYYPQLKLSDVLASVAIKPGFQACAVDFDIPKIVNRASTERIRLLVVMKDNTDTSSCIVNPPEVNFLLNGVGLQGKIVGCMYRGPQLPPIVNPMLRYGTNLLQVIGQFDAHYIVLVAYMNSIEPSDLPTPHDYQQPPATVDSEAEIVEGSSKISLNCPISLKRIRQPAKGHLCKHLQCFDLNNYTEINFKCPSWKCPHCNQPVCYPDIRIDQKMAKILQDVSEGARSVIVHSDGSWVEASCFSTNPNDESHVKVSQGLQQGQKETTGMEIDPSNNVYDLTQACDEVISLDTNSPEEQKAAVQPQAIRTPVNQDEGISFSGPLGSCSAQPDYNSRANPGLFVQQQSSLGMGGSPTFVCPPFDYNAFMQQLQHEQMNGGYAIPGNVTLPVNTFPQNSASASTSVHSPDMESLRLWYLSQQRLSAQMRGYGAPVQVTSNEFRPTSHPGNQGPCQPNLMNYAALRHRRASQVRSQMGAPGGSGYGAVPQRLSRTEDPVNEQPLPTGRMRGSLAAGRSCDQYVIRPTQQTVLTPPNHNNTLSPHVQALLANRNLYSQPNFARNSSTSAPDPTHQLS